ncbi:MAG: 2-hydroxyacid dehydrogenase [Thermoleophilia bacterium]|jgi:phosphoglycerate dehydrogenase-like enzyme
MRIVFCGNGFASVSDFLGRRLDPAKDEVIVCADEQAIMAAAPGAAVVIPGMYRIDAGLLDAGDFRLIQQWGAGVEGVDLDAARARGVWVANVPAAGKNAESVAEHVILLLLALLRRLPVAQANLRAGILGAPMGRALAGLTICLYGLGHVAKALVQRLRAFDVNLIGLTRDPLAAKVPGFGLAAVYALQDRRACLSQTDVLVICTPLTEETRGSIDDEALAALPSGALVINAARGPVVQYEALYETLVGGHLGGAGLDVFWTEPFPPDDPLLALPNVVATPHVAGVTDLSYAEIADAVTINIERLRRGESPLHRVA